MNNYYIYQNSNTRIKFEIESHSFNHTDYSQVYKIKAPFLLQKRSFNKYNDKQQNDRIKSKISYMIDHQPKTLKNISAKICWPLQIVYDKDNRFMGYLAPSPFINSVPLKTILKNDDISKEWHNQFKTLQERRNFGMQVCIGVCRAVQALEDYDLTGLGPQNFSINSNGEVTVIECDALHIAKEFSEVMPSAQSLSTDYKPPRQAATQEPNNDYKFTLAVLLYQVLFKIHPYQMASIHSQPQLNGSNSSNIDFVHGKNNNKTSHIDALHQGFNELNPVVQKLFIKAFSSESQTERPSAKTWFQTLSENIVFPPVEPLISSNFNTQPLEEKDVFYESVDTPFQPKPRDHSFIIYAIVVPGIIVGLSVSYNLITDNKDALLDITNEHQVMPSQADNEVDDSTKFIEKYKDTKVEGSSLRSEMAEPETEEVVYPPVTDRTNTCVYVLYDKANMRYQPSLSAPVVTTWDYNSKLCRTSQELVVKGNAVWMNVISSNDTVGWMDSSTLSKYPRTVYYSECAPGTADRPYTVEAVGANIRSRPSKDDDAVIGIIQQNEIVCPNRYIDSNNEDIGYWIGFDVVGGGTAWVSENLLEPYNNY